MPALIAGMSFLLILFAAFYSSQDEQALQSTAIDPRTADQKHTADNPVRVTTAESSRNGSVGVDAIDNEIPNDRQDLISAKGQSSSLQATQAETLDNDEDLALQDIPLEDFDAAYEAFISEEDSLSESEDWEQIVIESRQGQSSQDNGLYDDDVELIFDGQTGIYSYPPEK